MGALLFALIWIVFSPAMLIVWVAYVAHEVFLSRKIGVSSTALGPMSARWMQHQLGLRRDDACARLIKVLPNHCYAGLYAAAFPVLLDDPRLYAASNAYGLTNVPTVFWIGQDGEIEVSSVGWVKSDFEEIGRKMAEAGKTPPAALFKPGEEVRDFRPG